MVLVTRRQALTGTLATFFVSGPRIAAADVAPAPLKDLAKARGILYGSSVSSSQFVANDDFTSLVLAQCACVVPEAEMKWGEMTTPAGKEDYSAPDRFVDFAGKHGLAVRGTTLLWFQNTPDWFKALASRKSAEDAMVRRITDMCSRYRDRVFCWDVVNEAINVSDGRPDNLRKAVFLDKIGPEYIDLAHHVARAADPHVRLVVNDYNVEYDTPEHDRKRMAVIRLLERMKKAGTPVDALGIEAHLHAVGYPFSQAKLRQFLAEVAAMGLDIHITELDVSDERTPAFFATRDQLVASEYERFLDVALDEPAVKVVVTWGLSDRYTWINGAPEEGGSSFGRSDGQLARPLPFDAALARKPAWSALVRAFQGARSRTAATLVPSVAPTRGGP